MHPSSSSFPSLTLIDHSFNILPLGQPAIPAGPRSTFILRWPAIWCAKTPSSHASRSRRRPTLIASFSSPLLCQTITPRSFPLNSPIQSICSALLDAEDCPPATETPLVDVHLSNRIESHRKPCIPEPSPLLQASFLNNYLSPTCELPFFHQTHSLLQQLDNERH